MILEYRDFIAKTPHGAKFFNVDEIPVLEGEVAVFLNIKVLITKVHEVIKSLKKAPDFQAEERSSLQSFVAEACSELDEMESAIKAVLLKYQIT